jgi:toxin ParE1/3/4
MRISWTPAAAADLEHISNYLQERNPTSASRPCASCTRLFVPSKSYPQHGRPGREDGTRELLFPPTPYIAVYRLQEQSIEVLRIYHAAQDRL